MLCESNKFISVFIRKVSNMKKVVNTDVCSSLRLIQLYY
jgi:hypothetical protein